MRISMVEASIPRTFYNINQNNNTLLFNGILLSLPFGNYDIYTLRENLQTLLSPHQVTVTFHEFTNGYTFTREPQSLASGDGAGTLTFSRGAARLLGFDEGTVSLPCTSVRPALLSYPLVLYVNSDIPQLHSIDNLANPQVATPTHIFGKVDVSVAPFDMVQYHEPSSVYSINVASQDVAGATFWVTGEDAEEFPLLHPYSITLLVEFLAPADDIEGLKKVMGKCAEILNLLWLKEPPPKYDTN
jgi:hypothetical protein